MTIKGGSGVGGLTPNGKTILNFHFDCLHPSLVITLFSENFTTFSTGFNHCNFSFRSRSRPFPRMEASDSLPECWEWVLSIPFPFPNWQKSFPLTPDSGQGSYWWQNPSDSLYLLHSSVIHNLTSGSLFGVKGGEINAVDYISPVLNVQKITRSFSCFNRSSVGSHEAFGQ